ncbi:MAG: hypothetical protein ACMUIG_09485 [Thermoplasmatota archaeon]
MKREEYIYYAFMKRATQDKYISLDESGLILILEDNLGLSDDKMDEIMGMIEEGIEPDLTQEEIDEIIDDMSNHPYEVKIYGKILKEAVMDETIGKDEFSLMAVLTDLLKISKHERKEIYDHIKKDIKRESFEEDHPSMIERARSFLGLK